MTPFRAMAAQAAHEHLAHRIHLFFSNRRPEDAAFLDTLSGLQEINPNFHLIATMTDGEKSSRPWKGETGFIRRAMLERYIPDLKAPIWYFAGPPAMTAAMKQMLDGLGIGEQDMRYEEFYGY